MTAIHHLRRETKCLPVKSHSQLLTTQFIQQTKSPTHPCHETIWACPQPQRNIKQEMKEFYNNEVTSKALPEDNIKNIHKAYVAHYIESEPPNRVLGYQPDHDPEEKSLTREEEVRLAQLRSGFCPLLNDYKYRIKARDDEQCREGKQLPETVTHVFECHFKEAPTILWTDPKRAAEITESL